MIIHGEKFFSQNSKISFAGRLSVAVATWTVDIEKKLYQKQKNISYRSIQMYVTDNLLTRQIIS